MSEHQHDQIIFRLASEGWSNVAIGRELGKGREYVRARRLALGLPASTATGGSSARRDADLPGGGSTEFILEGEGGESLSRSKMDIDLGAGEGEFRDVITSKPLRDWSHIFEFFELDPSEYEIVDDTIRASVWMQSALDKRTGERSTIKLRSYRARFRRVSKNHGVSLGAIRRDLMAWAPAPRPRSIGAPEAFVVCLADWQLGKGEGDGTAGTVNRIRNGLDDTVSEVDRLRRSGRNISSLVIANLGDHTEGTHGSYANQSYTIDLNLRDQLQLALELNLEWIKLLSPLFSEVQYAATICNHGTLSRAGGRENITDDADNATGLIGDLLERSCRMHPALSDINFVVPRGEMITTITAAGVNIAMAHGQKVSGDESKWLAAQSQNLIHRRSFVPHLWLTAHKHHASLVDYGPYTRIQATTVDPGSKWFEDASGQYSRPGVTTFTVSEQLPGRWDNYKIL